MKIIVTGASGFIGSYLSSALLQNHDVYAIGTRRNIDQISTIFGYVIPYYPCNYSLNQLDYILKNVKPDVLVNLAAQRPNEKLSEPGNYFVNLRIAANIFEASLHNNLPNIIDFSTRKVYSLSNEVPWSEADCLAPNDYYSLSKQWAENAAAYYNRKGLNIKTLRLAQVIGIGEREGYVLQLYLKNAMHGLPLRVYGKCDGKRHFVYVKDVVGAIEAAIACPQKSGIYNIGMLGSYGFDELAHTINAVFGGKSEVVYHQDAKADESIYHMSIDKARLEIGWLPHYDLYATYVDMKQDIELYQIQV